MVSASMDHALAEEAVIATYPLYEMSRMRAATSPRRTDADGAAPEGQRWCNVFAHGRALLAAGKSRVVMPNNDTLYTNAWLDLGAGPLVIDVPDTAGRYYVLGLLDFYTEPFAHIGQRLTGTQARSFLITPPGWAGSVPAGFEAPGAHVVASTRWLWVIGRILVDGPQDVAAVNALQNGFTVRALADWRDGTAPRALAFDPACDPKEPLSAEHFATQVNQALRENPPSASETASMARFAPLGIGAAAGPLDAAQRDALQAALDRTLLRMRGTQAGQVTAAGWTLMPLVEGSFGGDHLRRALIALKGIGMLESREATYPMAWKDVAGQALDGRHRYQLRFAPDALPPVDAFWSLTLYDSGDYMLVDNAIDRYAIGDRTPGLRRDADGGLTLHIAHAPPADEAARDNWLPAPAGGFYLCLRAYVPHAELLDGRYVLPGVTPVQELV